MNTKLSITIFYLFLSWALACGRDPDWFNRRNAQLDQAIHLKDGGEKIESLADFVQIGVNGRMDDEQKAIYTKSQAALLQTPGHATYFQNKLESLRVRVLEVSKQDDPLKMKVGAAYRDYDDFRKETFRTLGQLPSSETVAVLGHFLNDPEGRDGKDILGYTQTISDAVPFPINAGAATVAIRGLGIEHPPYRQPSYYGVYDFSLQEIDAWKDWWNEVKEGKRTYRFIGSPIEYGPDGPASKEQLQRIERNRQREASSKDPRSAATSPAADGPSEKPNPITGIAIGATLLVLLASIFYVLRAKKRSAE